MRFYDSNRYADKYTIDAIIGHESQNPDNKINLNRMIGYCENIVDCRRVLQLKVCLLYFLYFIFCFIGGFSDVFQYFGEDFDAARCNKTCDNCRLGGEKVVKDVTDAAKKFTAIVKETCNGKITLKMCMDILYTLFVLFYVFDRQLNIFTGSSTKASEGKGHSYVAGFGSGKDWNKSDAERLAHLLVIEEVLMEEVVFGFKNSQIAYVKVITFPFLFIY